MAFAIIGGSVRGNDADADRAAFPLRHLVPRQGTGASCGVTRRHRASHLGEIQEKRTVLRLLFNASFDENCHPNTSGLIQTPHHSIRSPRG